MSIELRQAAQRALNALDEATTYTGSPSWSPSMTDECIAAASALRAALSQQPATGEPAATIHEAMASALAQLRDAHRCNMAELRPTEVHRICFEALEVAKRTTHEPVDHVGDRADMVAGNGVGIAAQQPATSEPVWFHKHWYDGDDIFYRPDDNIPPGSVPLYTHPAPGVPDDDFDLICSAIDKADTITMEGDYMLDSDDCIAVVRVMQVLLSVRAAMLAAK